MQLFFKPPIIMDIPTKTFLVDVYPTDNITDLKKNIMTKLSKADNVYNNFFVKSITTFNMRNIADNIICSNIFIHGEMLNIVYDITRC